MRRCTCRVQQAAQLLFGCARPWLSQSCLYTRYECSTYSKRYSKQSSVSLSSIESCCAGDITMLRELAKWQSRTACAVHLMSSCPNASSNELHNAGLKTHISPTRYDQTGRSTYQPVHDHTADYHHNAVLDHTVGLDHAVGQLGLHRAAAVDHLAPT